MADNRRQFIKRGGVLLGAAALSPVSPVMGAPGLAPARTVAALPKPVTDFLHRCGVREVLLRGGSVLSTANPLVSIDVVAVTPDPVQLFQRTLKDRPFQNPYASGSVLSFSSEDVFYNVEGMNRAGQRDLRARLTAGEGIHFAHEGLLQSVEGGAAFDPWGVLATGGRTLRMVGKTDLPLGEKVGALITALVDGVLYKLQPVAAMTAFHNQVLASLPANDVEAKAVTDEVTAGINRMAWCSRTSSIERLFTSPLISTSLERIFDRTGAQVLATVRSHSAPGDQPGAPWLLGILGAERLRIRQGAVWIQDPDRGSFLQTKSALAAARTLANTLP